MRHWWLWSHPGIVSCFGSDDNDILHGWWHPYCTTVPQFCFTSSDSETALKTRPTGLSFCLCVRPDEETVQHLHRVRIHTFTSFEVMHVFTNTFFKKKYPLTIYLFWVNIVDAGLDCYFYARFAHKLGKNIFVYLIGYMLFFLTITLNTKLHKYKILIHKQINTIMTTFRLYSKNLVMWYNQWHKTTPYWSFLTWTLFILEIRLIKEAIYVMSLIQSLCWGLSGLF